MAAISAAGWIAIAGLAVSSAGVYMANKSAQEANRFRKKAFATNKAEADAQNAQARKMQVRKERIRRAQIISAAANTGGAMSSGASGATSAVGSLVGGNIANMNRSQNTSDSVSIFNQGYASNMSQSNTWGGVSSIGGSIFNFAAASGQPFIEPG